MSWESPLNTNKPLFSLETGVGGRGGRESGRPAEEAQPAVYTHTLTLQGQRSVPRPRSPGESVPGSPKANLQRLLMIPLPEAGPSRTAAKGSSGVDAVQAMGPHQTPAQMQTGWAARA